MNTITPISNSNNKNNNISFQRLKGIYCYNKFLPKKNADDAEAIQAFKDSELFKEFFKKYTGTAIFNKNWYTPRQQSRLELRIKYPKNEDIQTPKNPIKKLFLKIKYYFNEDSKYNLILHFDGKWKNWFERPSDELKSVIKNLTEQDLNQKLLKAVEKAKTDEKEINRIAELSKKLNME